MLMPPKKYAAYLFLTRDSFPFICRGPDYMGVYEWFNILAFMIPFY